jgi:hypothetical protein
MVCAVDPLLRQGLLCSLRDENCARTQNGERRVFLSWSPTISMHLPYCVLLGDWETEGEKEIRNGVRLFLHSDGPAAFGNNSRTPYTGMRIHAPKDSHVDTLANNPELRNRE